MGGIDGQMTWDIQQNNGRFAAFAGVVFGKRYLIKLTMNAVQVITVPFLFDIAFSFCIIFATLMILHSSPGRIA
jgi:hypothetical protein